MTVNTHNIKQRQAHTHAPTDTLALVWEAAVSEDRLVGYDLKRSLVAG